MKRKIVLGLVVRAQLVQEKTTYRSLDSSDKKQASTNNVDRNGGQSRQIAGMNVGRYSLSVVRPSNHSRTHRKGSTTPYGPHALIAFITASEPSSLITRFMLYASTCKLISVLTRPMVRVRK